MWFLTLVANWVPCTSYGFHVRPASIYTARIPTHTSTACLSDKASQLRPHNVKAYAEQTQYFEHTSFLLRPHVFQEQLPPPGDCQRSLPQGSQRQPGAAIDTRRQLPRNLWGKFPTSIVLPLSITEDGLFDLPATSRDGQLETETPNSQPATGSKGLNLPSMPYGH